MSWHLIAWCNLRNEYRGLLPHRDARPVHCDLSLGRAMTAAITRPASPAEKALVRLWLVLGPTAPPDLYMGPDAEWVEALDILKKSLAKFPAGRATLSRYGGAK